MIIFVAGLIITSFLSKNTGLAPDVMAKIYDCRAGAQERLKRFDEAIRDIDKSKRLQPNGSYYRWKAARLLMAAGHLKDSRAELEQLVCDVADFGPALADLAMHHIISKDLESALQLASKAIELSKKGSKDHAAHAFLVRALAYQRLERLELCLEDLNSCIEVFPVSRYTPEAPYLFRAQILKQLGSHRLALDSLHMAQQLNHSLRDILEQRWIAHWSLGNLDAAAHYAEALTRAGESDARLVCLCHIAPEPGKATGCQACCREGP
jgi:tetratricopeptide (TPR) repeat protein